ncbi:MAG: ABC transporter ATP-binding protein [candidate division WOR-3 bacterium]|uniref:ABC transporter ATP-binding protein n=1 Tax=candidate division WOR-3 bacterium TaxID=2052148 RepID=A0A7C4S1D2_UNCW3
MAEEGILKIENLNKSFDGLKAVKDFNLILKEGELCGLIGPNGAGKTTVFNLITGFYKPDSGKIIFQNKDITNLLPHQIVHLGISRTFQNIRLFNNLTVLENILFAFNYQINYSTTESILRIGNFKKVEKEVKEKCYQFLKLFDLEKKVNILAKNLPYGEMRKLEIARALALNPKLLLLDEPSCGMTIGETSLLMDLIKFIKEKFKLTIFIIEHQMRVIMNLCERIVVMDFGEIIAEGKPEEIQNNPKVIAAYLGREYALH